jgi:hypothetical protein
VAKKPAVAHKPNAEIFINCPFDDDYLPLLQALLFTITVSGYSARCALEDADVSKLRYSKILKLIEDSDNSVHDLSRLALSDERYPRFNMPFELGLTFGAKEFGRSRQSKKKACVMIDKAFDHQRIISDLAGVDPKHHNNDPAEVIKIIRAHLHNDPDGAPLPGAELLATVFGKFLEALPDLAKAAKLTLKEVHAINHYRSFMDLLRDWVAGVKGLEDVLF